LNDGRVVSERIDVPLGHPEHPMTALDFSQKASDCFAASARALDGQALERLRSQIDHLHSMPDASKLARFHEAKVG
jgi:hypothetical protein